MRGLAAAVLAATLFTLAFPTTEIAPLAFVALVPLLVTMRTRTRWQRFRIGWLAGFLTELVLFRWIPFTLTAMTPLPDAVTWGMCLLYAAWHGLRIGVFLALAEPVRRATLARFAPLAPVAVAALYAVVEWLWPVIFPWALGHAAWEIPGASALLALQGVPLLTFVVALFNAAFSEAFIHRKALAHAHLLGPAVALGLVLVPAVLFAPSPTGESIRVAIVQPNFTLAEKKGATQATRKVLLERLLGLVRQIPRDTFDLVIASEGAFPMWWRLDADDPKAPMNAQLEATRRLQKAIAEGPHTHAVFGGLRVEPAPARISHNSAVHLGPDGTLLGHYDKQTLVPFSEYVPFSDIIPALRDIPGISHLTPGETACRFPIASKSLGHDLLLTCGICYESMFPDKTRRDAGLARLLVNLTIDTWFGTSTAPRLHLMTQAARAAELGIPLVRSALTGISGVVDGNGHLVAELPRDQPGVLDATVTLFDGDTVFRALGQFFAPFATALCIALLVDAYRRRRLLFPLANPPREEPPT